jgi:hypothetical protein
MIRRSITIPVGANEKPGSWVQNYKLKVRQLLSADAPFYPANVKLIEMKQSKGTILISR